MGLKCRVCGQAMAAHNSGGIVIVQVERLVAPGSLNSRVVHLPGAIVDKVTATHPHNSRRNGWACFLAT